jgi:hypothetical protein
VKAAIEIEIRGDAVVEAELVEHTLASAARQPRAQRRIIK